MRRHPDGDGRLPGGGRQRPLDRQHDRDRAGPVRRPQPLEAVPVGSIGRIGCHAEGDDLAPVGRHHRQRLARLAPLETVDGRHALGVPGVGGEAVARLGGDHQDAAPIEQGTQPAEEIGVGEDRGEGDPAGQLWRLVAQEAALSSSSAPSISSRAWESDSSVTLRPASMRATSWTRSSPSSPATDVAVRSPSTVLTTR